MEQLEMGLKEKLNSFKEDLEGEEHSSFIKEEKISFL
jgi:hypothetical protein